jgi:predicted Zn-dependent protease
MPRVRYAVRILAWVSCALALPVALGGIAGSMGALIGGAGAVVATLWLWLWLPRSAHAAFQAGRFARAARRYRVLGWIAGSAARERSALLSRTGCCVGLGELDRADALLGTLDGARLDASERAVWLNNRACSALERDPQAALALIDEASALRPDVPALQHTRGMALLAVGRVDDAIAVLDGMRAAGELPPRLEAERCRDLARAWTQKGETAYADDYRQRAAAHSR